VSANQGILIIDPGKLRSATFRAAPNLAEGAIVGLPIVFPRQPRRAADGLAGSNVIDLIRIDVERAGGCSRRRSTPARELYRPELRPTRSGFGNVGAT